ncbi:MAG: hypothetical protein AB7E79_01720 [Rhodospirillaceae bacterium]
MRTKTVVIATLVGSAVIAAEPAPFSAPRYVDRAAPVTVCGLNAASLDQVANVLVEKGGVREAAGDQKFLAFESLDRTHIWTFTRLGHAAHPAVICRELKDSAAGLAIGMDFVCGGSRLECDALYGEFVDLNEAMKEKARKPS